MTWVLKVDDDFAYLASDGGFVRYQIVAKKFMTRSGVYAARKENPGSRIVKLVPKQPATIDDPWGVFLHHRARLIHRWTCEGRSAEAIARDLSMDPGQVRLIHAYVVDCPEDFRDKVKPVPVPMARSVAREKRTAQPSPAVQTERPTDKK